MKKESIKTFFKSQCPPDSGKIEQWYIDNIDSAELDTILLELLKECTRQDEPKTRDAFNRTCIVWASKRPKSRGKGRYTVGHREWQPAY